MKKTLIILALLTAPLAVFAQVASSTTSTSTAPVVADTSTSSTSTSTTTPADTSTATASSTTTSTATSTTTSATSTATTIDTASIAPAPATTTTTVTPVAPASALLTPDTGAKPRDTSPPSSVNDLAVVTASSKSVSVSWTAPQDDSGEIAGYDLRLSRGTLDESTWTSAIQFGGTPSDTKSGEEEQAELTGLPEGVTLHIGIKSYDAAGNRSPLSNVISVTTKPMTGTSQASSIRADLNGISAVTAVNPSSVSPSTNTATSDPGQGSVRVTITLPNGLPSDLPVYVNFVNNVSGQSYGGPTVNGLASYKIPSGDYFVRLVILDPNYQEPRNPTIFHLDANEDKDLGSIRLDAASKTDGTAGLTTVANSTGGVTKLLMIIIKMLGEILQVLMKTSPQQGV